MSFSIVIICFPEILSTEFMFSFLNFISKNSIKYWYINYSTFYLFLMSFLRLNMVIWRSYRLIICILFHPFFLRFSIFLFWSLFFNHLFPYLFGFWFKCFFSLFHFLKSHFLLFRTFIFFHFLLLLRNLFLIFFSLICNLFFLNFLFYNLSFFSFICLFFV